MKSFNINCWVKVRLTEEALFVLEKQHNKLYESFGKTVEFTPPKQDEHGYYKFQLWDLMSRLGGMCTLGFKSPFIECEMLIDERDLTDYEQ